MTIRDLSSRWQISFSHFIIILDDYIICLDDKSRLFFIIILDDYIICLDDKSRLFFYNYFRWLYEICLDDKFVYSL